MKTRRQWKKNCSMKKRLIVGLFFILFVMCLGGCASVQLKNKDEATKLSKHGMEAYLQGRYQDALSYFEKSLKITRQLNNSAGISINLNGIGLVYLSLHRYDEALSYFEDSLKISRQLNIPQESLIAILNIIGTTYDHLGRHDDAIKYYEEALKIKRGLSGTASSQSKGEAFRLYQKGQEAYKYGRYQEALKYYDESLKIYRQLNVPQDIAASLNNIGQVYASLGQHE